MRIVILSDSHRMVPTLTDIVEQYVDSADLFIFLGDGEKDFDSVLDHHPDLKCERVAGNCDLYSDLPDELQISVGGKQIFLAHGHTYGVKHGYINIIDAARKRNADILLFGHTHTQFTDYKDGLYIMNPGSVGFNGEYGIIDITEKGDIMLIKETTR